MMKEEGPGDARGDLRATAIKIIYLCRSGWVNGFHPPGATGVFVLREPIGSVVVRAVAFAGHGDVDVMIASPQAA